MRLAVMTIGANATVCIAGVKRFAVISIVANWMVCMRCAVTTIGSMVWVICGAVFLLPTNMAMLKAAQAKRLVVIAALFSVFMMFSRKI
jgi:hypothetical protein